ncbi:HAD hydrolase family protein [Alteromonas naphthalenivorans]|uniref:Capsule biosynthesis phosphatase n=1 Tax=Alteromonas naphthalenivorans TaxID=715451 RepID=F5Z651_ALTNA|nr:HAD hydrolase family protein [Alteromonas naphthalenivorans]AEF05284.1 capsule biosynthesis phosphatase [Alteromonas naphthalenivorans]
MKRLVVDLDGTLTLANTSDYCNVLPNKPLIEVLRKYKNDGFTIVIATARNMRTFKGDIGLINVKTLPLIIDWLNRHNIPYDEIIVGKPWCGFEGFYIDDKAIRPSEFISMNYQEIMELLEKENKSKESGNEV